MIVLNAANKSLAVKAQVAPESAGTAVASAVVSYWSIDASNVWTPASFEVPVINTVLFATTGSGVPRLLPAPSVGEVSRVVENIWIKMTASAVKLSVLLDVAGVQISIAELDGFSTGLDGTVFTLNRDGSFIRQKAQHGGTTIRQNEN